MRGARPTDTDVDGCPTATARAASPAISREIDPDLRQRRLAREIHEVLGKPAQSLDLPKHVLQGVVVFAREDAAAAGPHELHAAADDPQRIPDLVSDHRAHPGQCVAKCGALRLAAAPSLGARPAQRDHSQRQRSGRGDADADPCRSHERRPGPRELLPGFEPKHRVHSPIRAADRKVTRGDRYRSKGV